MAEDKSNHPLASAEAGSIRDNTGDVAVGSGIAQTRADIHPVFNVTTTIGTSESPPPSAIGLPSALAQPVRWHDTRPDEARLPATELSPAEEERLYNLSYLLRVSRCLVFKRDTILLPLSHLFSRARADGLDHHYQATCWFMLEPKSELFALAPALPKLDLNPAMLIGKNPIARAINLGRALRQNPTLLILQGFDDPQVKSLPTDFSALLEMALEDDIGRSSIVILSAIQNLTSRWGAKLVATTGY